MQNSENESKSFPMKRIIMLFFLFGIVLTLTAQNKINLDTLDIDQVNLSKYNKAVRMRNAGMICTLGGIAIAVAGYSIGSNYHSEEGGYSDLPGAAIAILSVTVGIPIAIVGIPLWAIGGSRKADAVLAIQKINVAPKKSIAFGLGVTLAF